MYIRVNSNPTLMSKKTLTQLSSGGLSSCDASLLQHVPWYTPSALHIHHSIFTFTTPRLLLSRCPIFFRTNRARAPVISVWTFSGLGRRRVGRKDNGVLILCKNGWMGEQRRWSRLEVDILDPTPHVRLPCVSPKMDWINPFRWRKHTCFSQFYEIAQRVGTLEKCKVSLDFILHENIHLSWFADFQLFVPLFYLIQRQQ